MLKWKITCLALMVCFAARVQAQDDSYTSRVQRYIKQYKSLAISEQKRSGIPAAITLGQGILETQAGASELATGANNHFGIKCKKEWKGETFAHTDDAPNECFRKYPKAEDSYRDHSDYLKSSARYASLFKLSETDYAGWAVGLKKCGYATNPRYAQQLIKIIEDFKLQDFTYAGMDNDEEYQHDGTASSKAGSRTPAIMDDDDPVLVRAKLQSPSSPAAAAAIQAAATPPVTASAAGPKNAPPPKQQAITTVQRTNTTSEQQEAKQIQATNRTLDNAKPVTVNGLKAVYAFKGELPFQYALKFNIRYEHLLEMNDLPDAPLASNMFIYLERKNVKGQQAYHIVKTGETMAEIAQLEGVQLRRMMAMNHIDANEEPVAGTQLYLQDNAPRKPQVTTSKNGAEQNGAFLADMGRPSTQGSNYIDKNTIEQGNPALKDDGLLKRQPANRNADVPAASPASENKPAQSIATIKTNNVQPEATSPQAALPVTAAEKPAPAAPVAANYEPPAPKAKPASERPAPATAATGSPSMLKPAFHPMAGNTPKVTNAENKTVTPAATTTASQPVAPPEVTEDNKTQEPLSATVTAPVSSPKAEPIGELKKRESAVPVVVETKPAPMPAVAEVKTEVAAATEKPAEAVTEHKQAATVNPPQEEEPMDELDRLKARLDRVVYVNDKKVAAVNNQNTTGSNMASAASVDKTKYYTVRDGDTAFSIARDNNISMKQLMDWNDLNFEQIKVGQKLRVKE